MDATYEEVTVKRPIDCLGKWAVCLISRRSFEMEINSSIKRKGDETNMCGKYQMMKGLHAVLKSL